MLLPRCLFEPRLGSVNARRSCRKVHPNIPLLAPRKVLRHQGQASAGSVLGSNVSASGMAGSVPSVSAAIGGREVPDAPASPLPNPTPSAGVVLSEAEVEKSMQKGMAALERLPRFGLDFALKRALPQQSEVRPPPMAETPASTVGAGASTVA
jgi:hypothetical protein